MTDATDAAVITNDSTTDLDEYAPPPVPQGFTIHDASSASWVVRKVVEARAYADRVRAWGAAEVRRAENEERYFMQRFGGQLEGWAREYLQSSGSRRRSIPLPSGTVGFRGAAARLVMADEAVVLDWCRRHLPDAVAIEIDVKGAAATVLRTWLRDHCTSATTVERVLKCVLDKHFQKTGECPAGAECATGEKFFVK